MPNVAFRGGGGVCRLFLGPVTQGVFVTKYIIPRFMAKKSGPKGINLKEKGKAKVVIFMSSFVCGSGLATLVQYVLKFSLIQGEMTVGPI